MDRTHDGAAIALHWATAILVLLQFGLAEIWDFFPHPTRHIFIVAHMSFGLILTAVILLRLGRRLRQGMVPANRAAKAMHITLYALVSAEILLGFVTRWTDNQALSFFGLLIPSPLGKFSHATGRFVDQIHDYNAWLIIILVAGHAVAALFHHYVLQDNMLRRMLPRAKATTPVVKVP